MITSSVKEHFQKGGQKMGAAMAQERIYTVQDIEATPEWERLELIDGVIYAMTVPVTVHQKLLVDLVVTISNYIRDSRGDCQVFPAPFGVYLFDDDYHLLEPDISVICDPEKIDEKGCHGAPDWIIEIISPTTKQRDYMLKLFKYREAGVRLYWIVDPQEKLVTVYYFEKGEITHFPFGESIPVDLDPSLILTVQL